MGLDFGTGVSRTLSAIERQFGTVIWQKGKPPLDSEFNLQGHIDMERVAGVVRSMMPSGFFLDPTRAANDYRFNRQWANLFVFANPRSPTGVHETGEKQPVIWANVNGWIVPVAGTDISAEGDLRNWIKLYPPPESDSRIDLVFLEVWLSRVAPNPSTANKPNNSSVWKYGNVKYGGTNLTDDLEDSAIGFETTERVQIQYRIRVFGQGVGLGAGSTLDVYPDGLDDPNVLGQGAASAPVSGFQYANMREAMGDPGLWRAGDGNPNNNLGTVDGYTYAVPICAVFRRNSNQYMAVASSGNPNQNGAFERTPGSKFLANPLDGAKALGAATLTSLLPHNVGVSSNAVINITGLNGSGWEDVKHVLTSTFMVIDDEVISISAVDVNNGQITIPGTPTQSGRGRWGTAAVGHQAGAEVKFFNSRPDGLYADEIHVNDVLDMRRGVNPGDWDFQRILEHNVAALAKGELRSTWKGSAAGDTEGVVIHEVDYLHADGAATNPNHTEALDGPDGIRMIWSDGATIQPDIALLLDNDATQVANGVGLTTNDQFDTSVFWDVGPDFKPVGFLNVQGAASPNAFTNGSTVLLFIGGETGTEGARSTFRASPNPQDVRFVTPKEFWKTGFPVVDPANGNQHPVTLRFVHEDARAHEPKPPGAGGGAITATHHPGPMFPWREHNFERPFIVLGGLLRSTLKVSVPAANLAQSMVDGSPQYEVDLGIDFDAAGSYFSKDANGEFETDPASVTNPLLRGQRTLFDMLTDHGRDRTGASSEVYLVIFGDQGSTQNNGAFKVVGAGTAASYTTKAAANATSVVVEPLSTDFVPYDGVNDGFNTVTGNNIQCELRSQFHNSEDTSDYASRVADLAIVLTDIQGAGNHPWSSTSLGAGTGYDTNPSTLDAGLGKNSVVGKALLSLTTLYHPGRSGMARVPDEIVRFALRGPAGSGSYLQQNGAAIDTTFSAFSGVPTNEVFYEPQHVQTWNRLPALGWHAPDAPNYGGNVVGYTEIDRESQLFVDKGSKTVIFRPFRDRLMTLQTLTYAELAAGESLIGEYTYATSGASKDGLQLFTRVGADPNSGKRMGFAVPREFMPRFGRQDIPCYVDLDAGQGNFLPGINHLFTDKADATSPVFNIIGGGDDNTTGGNFVGMMWFITGTPTDYGTADTVIGAVNNVPNIEARKTTTIDPLAPHAQGIIDALAAINSSEFGRGLRGIQLPPYYGIARLMGVYELEDFKAKGGRTFRSNRYEVEADPATNLLRSDVDKQTLFILQDGAKDLTLQDHDHTYIVPENVLDLTRIPGYGAGDDFDDYEYVVVCTTFGFARGFINQNNMVLVRNHNGQGVQRLDGTNLHLEGVPMCIPAPAGVNDPVYVAYNRTVYQGDPFMTRHGENRVTTDYEHRYGQISMSGQHALRTAIQQFDASGNFVPQVPNPRSFEVLASLDFYTTLGTGKVGGRLYPGTPLDVGYTEDTALAATRLPPASTTPPWRIFTRAFTAGQKHNTSRARATVEILDNDSLINGSAHGDVFRLRLGLLDGSVVDLHGVQSTRVADIAALGGYVVEDTFVVDIDSKVDSRIFEADDLNFGAAVQPLPGASARELVLPVGTYPELSGLVSGGWSVHVTPKAQYGNDYGHLVFDARPGADQITVRAVFTANPVPFSQFPSGDGLNIRTVNHDFGNVLSDATATHAVAWTGADQAKDQVVVVQAEPPLDGFAVVGYVSAADQITISVTNLTAGAIDPAPTDFHVTLLEDIDPAVWQIDVSDIDLTIEVVREQGDKTASADNLVAAINAHSKLGRAVRAFNDGTPKVTLEAVSVGAEGNGLTVAMSRQDALIADTDPGLATYPAAVSVQQTLKLEVQSDNAGLRGANVTRTHFRGGVDLPVNGGVGTSQLKLTGMIERLPLGVLLQDSDFLCENPLGEDASAMRTSPAGIQPIQTLLPLTTGGDEYTRFTGAPGELLGMADGAIAAVDSFDAYTTASPTGSKRFRLYRGGGSAFVLHGDNPGGPIDWVSDSIPGTLTPVLKGGALVCRAMLVRNFYEEAFSGSPFKVSDGDEIQMVVLTHGIFGSNPRDGAGYTFDGIISPSGYGEGYAAADRYRLMGRPMFRGYSREVPNPASTTLAVYDEASRTEGLPE